MFKRKFRTNFLTSQASLLIGAGSVFNLAGSYFMFNVSNSGAEADTRALECDWGMIGQDLQQAICFYEDEVKNANAKQLEFDFNV